MKKKCFSVEQIVTILKHSEPGTPVTELIRRVGISEQTFLRWKKQYLGLEIDQLRQSLKGHDVVRVLQRISKESGKARILFYDNGSEFTSRMMDLWAYHKHVSWLPGLGEVDLQGLDETGQRSEAWRVEYNVSRPHRALGERTPNEFAREIAASRDLSGLQTAGN